MFDIPFSESLMLEDIFRHKQFQNWLKNSQKIAIPKFICIKKCKKTVLYGNFMRSFIQRGIIHVKIPAEDRFFALFYARKFWFFDFGDIFQPILKVFVSENIFQHSKPISSTSYFILKRDRFGTFNLKSKKF